MTALLKRAQRLEAIRYFTASVRNDPPALARQSTYLGALNAHTGVQIVLGRFDTALLLSADSDLCPAVRALKRLRPHVRDRGA